MSRMWHGAEAKGDVYAAQAHGPKNLLFLKRILLRFISNPSPLGTHDWPKRRWRMIPTAICDSACQESRGSLAARAMWERTAIRRLHGKEQHETDLAQQLLALGERFLGAGVPRGEALDPPSLHLRPVDPVRILAGEESVLRGELFALGTHAQQLRRRVALERRLRHLERTEDVVGDVEQAIYLSHTQTC